MILDKGTPAPNFELNSTPDQNLKLSDFKRKRARRKIFQKNNADQSGCRYHNRCAGGNG